MREAFVSRFSIMEKILYRNRKNTNSYKWDSISKNNKKDNSICAWVADMDFAAPKCVRDSITKTAKFGVYGYFYPGDGYFKNFINCIRWSVF